MKYIKKTLAVMLIAVLAISGCPVFGMDAGEEASDASYADAVIEQSADDEVSAAFIDVPVEEAEESILPVPDETVTDNVSETAEEPSAQMYAERFSVGYIWIAEQTCAFADADLTVPIGIFSETSAGYALSRIACENEAGDVLCISFAASGEAYTGYIPADAILTMSESEIREYMDAVSDVIVVYADDLYPIANTHFEAEEDVPVTEEVPTEKVSAEEAPVTEEIPAEEAPVTEEVSTEEAPATEEVPTEEVSAEDVPATEEIPTEEAPAEEAPATEEVSTEEAPAEEAVIPDGEPPKTYLDAGSAAISGAVTAITIAAEGGVDAVREKTTLKMYAAVTPADADVGTVYWSSSNNTVATVNNDGVVTTKAVTQAQKVTITATAADGSGTKAEFVLTVTPIVNATKVVISGATNEVAVKGSIRLNAQVLAGDEPASIGDVTWKIKSGSKYAKIKDKGDGVVSVTGKKAGKVTIIAISKDGSKIASEPFTVIVKGKAASKVKISGPNGVTCIDAGGSQRTLDLAAAVSPKSASQKVAWSVDNKYADIADIDANGVLYVKEGAFGEVVVKATALDGSKKYGTLTVNVIDPVNRVGISADTDEVGLKASVTLRARTFSAHGDPTIPDVTWKVTSGSKYAKVKGYSDGTAKVTGLKKGKAVVTATAKDGSGVKASYTVYVKSKAVSSVKIATSTGLKFIDVGAGTPLTLTAKVSPSSASRKIVWNVDEQYHDIANVSADGVLTATGRETGPVKVTAKALDGSGKTGTITVYVGKPAASVSITGVNAVKIKKSIVLKAALTAADGTDADCGVTWKIASGKKYASIKTYADGSVKVTGKKAGKVTLVATAADGSGASAQVRISVKKSLSPLSIKGAENIDLNTVSEGRTVSFPLTASGETITWTSSDPGLFAVDQNGIVTLMAPKPGSAVITAVNEKGKQGSVTVKALYAVSDIALSGGIEDESGIHILKGSSAKISAKVSPENAADPSVKWKSSKTKTATVSSSGKVKGIKAGSATITATAKDGSGVKASVKVIVHEPAKSVKVYNSGASVKKGSILYLYSVGSRLDLSAAVSPSKAYQKVEWTSNNPTVATVDAGVVTAVSEGAAKITVKTLDGKNKSLSFYVVVGRPADQVTVYGPKEVTVGKKITLDAEVLPAGAVNKKVVWNVASGYTDRVSVSSDGVVKGKKAGYAKIIATAEGQGVSGEYLVYVAPKSTKVYIYSGDTNITGKTTRVYRNLGDGTVQLSARLNPSTADQSVSWKSSNTKIATVNANGVVTAKKKGTVTITATAKDGSKKKATAKLKITTGELGLQIVSTENLTALSAGSRTQLTAKVTPDGMESLGVFWRSDNEDLAVVDGNGMVTAKENVVGKVTITATCGGVSAGYTLDITCLPETVRIVAPESPVIDLNGAANTLSLSAVVEPGAASQAVLWTSSNENVAKVNAEGLVTGIASGEAVITAKHADKQDLSDSVTVKVVKLADGLSIKAAKTRLYGGESTQLTAAFTPADVDDRTLNWQSSSALVTVATSTDGKITAKVSEDADAVTEVTLTATTAETMDDISAKLTLTVSSVGAVFELADNGSTITGYKGTETVVYIPESVTKIASGAFDGCDGITGLIAGDHVEIETGALNGLESMRDESGFLVFDGHLLSYSGNSATVTIPAGITHIDDGAFENNIAIKRVKIPNTVSVIGNRAFAGCTNLSEMSCY